MTVKIGADLAEVLASLESFDDAELLTVIARAQGLLLDRPDPRGDVSTLSVEVVAREEGRLLASYRALTPLTQRRLVSHVRRLAHTSQRRALRPRLPLPSPAAVAATLLPRSKNTVAP